MGDAVYNIASPPATSFIYEKKSYDKYIGT